MQRQKANAALSLSSFVTRLFGIVMVYEAAASQALMVPKTGNSSFAAIVLKFAQDNDLPEEVSGLQNFTIQKIGNLLDLDATESNRTLKKLKLISHAAAARRFLPNSSMRVIGKVQVDL